MKTANTSMPNPHLPVGQVTRHAGTDKPPTYEDLQCYTMQAVLFHKQMFFMLVVCFFNIFFIFVCLRLLLLFL